MKQKGEIPLNKWTPEKGANVIDAVNRGVSLRTIFAAANMPHFTELFGWLADPELEEFARQYARARINATSADYLDLHRYEAAVTAPKRLPNPAYPAWEAAGRRGTEPPADIPNPAYLDAQHARVVMDSIKWRLSKMRPDLYGDRLNLDHSGSVDLGIAALAPAWIADRQPADDDAPQPSPPADPVGEGETVH